MNALSRDDIARDLTSLGLVGGDTVFVHSSLSSMGHVEGGAETVVDAFVDVLGPEGTLVVPTFTLARARKPGVVFDIVNDPSEVGRITEVVRTRPGARRSPHLILSVAALGAHSDMAAFHGPSGWAADGPFWRVHELDGRILLVGVPYLRCTYFHMIEQLLQAPYRRWEEFEARLLEPDGTLRPLVTRTFSTEKGFVGNDLNKLGAILEERGLVHVGAIGNAVARLFSARDAVSTGVDVYRDDPLLFVRTGDELTPLKDGVKVDEPEGEKSVLDPDRMYRG